LKSTGRALWPLLLAGSAAYAYGGTLAHMASEWRAEPQYSLAFLVPFVSGYFAWRNRRRALGAKPSPSVWGIILLGAALAVHLLASMLDISGPSAFSLLPFLAGCLLYLHGPNLLRALLFPLGFLAFAIPLPGGLTDLAGFPLQMWSSGASASLLGLLGLDVSRSGTSISVPGFDFRVAEACAGMSSLVAMMAVAAVISYTSGLPSGWKWAMFAMATPAALAANVVRITSIALVGSIWGSDAAMAWHGWSSPLLFATAAGILVAFGKGVRWTFERRDTSPQFS
jgi:exosortase